MICQNAMLKCVSNAKQQTCILPAFDWALQLVKYWSQLSTKVCKISNRNVMFVWSHRVFGLVSPQMLSLGILRNNPEDTFQCGMLCLWMCKTNLEFTFKTEPWEMQKPLKNSFLWCEESFWHFIHQVAICMELFWENLIVSDCKLISEQQKRVSCEMSKLK